MSDSIYNLGTARGVIELDASSLGRASASLQSVGLGMIALGAAAVAGFGYVVNKAATFEQVMSGAQSALGATNKQMQIVKQTALDLGANSIYGATNVAKAIEQLAYAGLSIQEITQGAAKATIDLAQASGGLISLDVAGRTVVNTMRTFGLGAKDAGHIADELAGAANKSTIDIEDMVTSLRYVGPVAHSAGIGLDDTAEALALLGDRGIRGSTAGTSLRGILIALVAPSQKATGVLKQLGIITQSGANIMFDASGKMKSLAEVAQILQDHTRGMTAQQKEAAFSAIFLRRAMASALVLSEQGAAGFAHYKAEIAAGGSASDIAAVRLDNLKGDLKLLHSQLETVLIKAGTPFQNMLRGWVQGLTNLVQWFGKLSPHTQTLILKVLAISGALLILAGTFLFVAGTALKMYRTFRDLIEGIKLVSGVFQLLGTTLLTNPLFLIIAAIVLLVIAFVVLWVKVKGFRDFWKAVWRDIQGAAQATWRFLTRIFNDVKKWLETAIPNALHSVRNAFSSTLKWIEDHWKLLVVILSGPFGPIVALILAYWGQITRGIHTAVDFVGRQMTLFGRWFGKNVTPTLKAFLDLLRAVWKDVVLIFNVAWLIIQPILKDFLNGLSVLSKLAADTFRLAMQVVKLALDFAIQSFKLFVGTMLNIWRPLWTSIVAVLQVALLVISRTLGVWFTAVLAIWHPFWHALISVVQAVWTALKLIVAGALQFIKGLLEIVTGIITLKWQKVWQGIKDIFEATWKGIFAVFQLAWKLLFTAIQFGFTTIVNFFTTVPGKVLSAIGDVTKLLLQKGEDIILSLWHGIWNQIKTVWTFLGGVKDDILAFFKDAGTWLLHVGEDIIHGLIKGITGAIGGIKNAVGGIAKKIIGWKGPPSYDKTLLVGNGQLIMAGLITGILNGLPGLKSTLGQATSLISTLGGPGVAGATSFGTFGAGAFSRVTRPVTPAVNVTVPMTQPTNGDTVQINVDGHQDPEQIVNAYFWAKRIRS